MKLFPLCFVSAVLSAQTMVDWNTQIKNKPVIPSASTAGAPNQSVQFNSGGSFAGDSTFLFNPTTKLLTAATYAGNGACLTGMGRIYAACYGISASNTGAQNDAAFATVFAMAYTPGQALPSDIQLPCGTLIVDHSVQIPHLVHLWGCGRGDSKQLVPPLGNGTVIQASSAFSGYSFPSDAVVVLGGLGPTSPELFNGELHYLEIDAHDVAGTGLMIGNCQEQCLPDNVIINNIVHYGIFTWGANNNSNGTPQNSPWGLPAGFQGAANDSIGEVEIYGYGGTTHSTIPVVIGNGAGEDWRGHVSIVMRDPSLDGGAHTPDLCLVAYGSSVNLTNFHCEGPRNGYYIGPSGIQYGGGAVNFNLTNMQYSSSAGGCTVLLQIALGATLSAIANTSGGNTICDLRNGYNGHDNFYTVDNNVATNVESVIGTRAGIHLDSPIITSNNMTAGGSVTSASAVISSLGPCQTIQYAAGTPYVFPYQQWCINVNGDIIHTFAGTLAGGDPLITAVHGDEYYQGPQTIAMGIGVNKAGLNLSNPGSSATALGDDVISLIGNNLSWDAVTGDFKVAFNGHPDADGLIFGYTGMRFVGNNSVTAGHYSNATVLGWQSGWIKNDGTQAWGNSGVSGVVASWTNSTGSCSITPNTGVACPSDARLKRDVAPLHGALETVLALDPVSFRWNRGTDTGVHAGLIAQEVQKLIPSVVHQGEDGYLTLNYAEVVPYLIEAIQTLERRVAELEKAH